MFDSNFNPSNPTRKENEGNLHKKRGKLNSFVGKKMKRYGKLSSPHKIK
jgi:hypothetical protein